MSKVSLSIAFVTHPASVYFSPGYEVKSHQLHPVKKKGVREVTVASMSINVQDMTIKKFTLESSTYQSGKNMQNQGIRTRSR